MGGRREEEDEEERDEEERDEEERDEEERDEEERDEEERDEEERDEEERDEEEEEDENNKQGGDRRDEDDGNPDGKTGGPGGGRTRSHQDQESSRKRQKRADVSRPTEYLLPTPEPIITSSPFPSSPSTLSPSSFSTIPSLFKMEHPGSVKKWCLSVEQEASTDITFIHTALPPNPLSFTTAEQVLPLKYWTHAEYIDYFSGLVSPSYWLRPWR
ncbi:hypothetical protein L202_03041 [Cryptococcus amylolentus CBS 6039]|uniref:Uncharacterized protein n=1 Tax=Cryptococcus amylolentus CBS 6039 TaxID=1295533 RepID=A0A1E3HX84_9TREE|nr:hypothetical protein L202_03041 [Cryptococcus amylolentus CBS 6039]ODN80917.1 hypothetical protein L202_03041 [Cryptococcus amylolentus CBS 6039]